MIIDNDLTRMANTSYSRACHCSDCGKKIEAGKRVWGYCYNGVSLSNRICNDCHEKKIDRMLNKLAELNK